MLKKTQTKQPPNPTKGKNPNQYPKNTQQKKKLLLIYRYLISGIQITEQITLFSSRIEKEWRQTEDSNFSSAEGHLKIFLHCLCLLKSSD